MTPFPASAVDNILKLEIGAGEHPCEGGFTHNDVVAYPHIELVGDGARPYDIACDSVRLVRAMHVLEHLGPQDAVAALREWRRILVPDGMIQLALPNGELLTSLWLQGQLTYAALIRDLRGLPPAEVPAPDEAAFREAWNKFGWTYGLKRWLYDPVADLPRGNAETAQTHRWAYGPGELRRLLEVSGFYRARVLIDGTALHAWASKAPMREPVLSFVVGGQRYGFDGHTTLGAGDMALGLGFPAKEEKV